MIAGVAHTGICVPNVDEAVEWYTRVLGLKLLAGPALMEGETIEQDMGELVPGIALKAAILGFDDSADRVLEVIEYPKVAGRPRPTDASITDHGYSHIGLVCDDIAKTRAELERKGVQFLTKGIASIAGLQTAWFRDRYGLVYILMEKRYTAKPYYQQF
jgi:catechol 2,3-dioxygenase-like lactoylglutathione lyase family enzyme